METTIRAKARELYKIYTDHSGGLNYQGLPCPKFDELPQPIQSHWEAVAASVMPPSENRAPDPSNAKYSPSVAKINEIAQAFHYHPAHSDQEARYAMVRDRFAALGFLVLEQTPPSRQQALAITNLEQACMWAIKAIACNEPGPVSPV